jgi:hypothetical protein
MSQCRTILSCMLAQGAAGPQDQVRVRRARKTPLVRTGRQDGSTGARRAGRQSRAAAAMDGRRLPDDFAADSARKQASSS